MQCFYLLVTNSILASYINRCSHPEIEEDIPEFEQCFLRESNNTREVLRTKGIPELGVPTVEYVVIPKITIDQKTRAFAFTCVFTNIGVQGLDNYVVESIQ